METAVEVQSNFFLPIHKLAHRQGFIDLWSWFLHSVTDSPLVIYHVYTLPPTLQRKQ